MCQPSSQDDDNSPATVSSDIIPIGVLEQKKIDAMNGNGIASNEIARHYLFGRNDYSGGLYWFLIGAENSHLESCNVLAYLLSYDENNNPRSIFWLYKMGIVNYRDALYQLEQLDLSLEEACPPDDNSILLMTNKQTIIMMFYLTFLPQSIGTV